MLSYNFLFIRQIDGLGLITLIAFLLLLLVLSRLFSMWLHGATARSKELNDLFTNK